MRKALFGVVLTGLFVLLLSALVVTPEGLPPDVSPLPPRDFHAVLMAAVLPAAQVDLTVPDAAEEIPLQARQQHQPAINGIVRSAFSDSNGRVLCAPRYENSFYQLFRPEVAGG